MELDATLTVTSDYRFRGISLSERRPALQAGVEVSHRGWFIGSWASTTVEDGDAGTELDFYAGRRGERGGLTYSVAVLGYLQPNDFASRYVEVQGLLGHRLGPVLLVLEGAYAPPHADLAGNGYVSLSASAPLGRSGVSLRGRGGIEDGLYARKLDWEVGAEWEYGPLTLAASLVGASERRARLRDGTALVLSLTGSW